MGRDRISVDLTMRQAVLDKLATYPLDIKEFVPIVLEATKLMLEGAYLDKPMREIIDQAPNKGAFIGQLFPIAFNSVFLSKFGTLFRAEREKYDKDVVNLVKEENSFEIKVSTSLTGINGNASYAWGVDSKAKSSFYLAVNFDKLDYSVILIRFGWLDIEDWTRSTSGQGQGSSVKVKPLRSKMITLYERHSL